MLKKTMTYEDFNGVERTENFYFNLSKAEVLEMEMSTEGGLAERIQKIVDAKDQVQIIKMFKELILKAYGEKSDDGKRFRKEDENGRKLCKNFEETEAFSMLFMELATDADAASAFVNGIVPVDIGKQAAKELIADNK